MKYFLFLFFAACGTEPDYETHQGMRVFSLDGFPTRGMVESACAATILALGGKGWKAFEGIELTVQDHPFDMGQQGLVNGYYSHFYETIGITATQSCWARTAFVHELIHVFQWKWEQVDDLSHEDPKWWSWTGVESRAQNFAVLNECPEDGPEWLDPETHRPIGGF